MFYKYDKEHLIWKRDWRKMKIALSTVIVLLFVSFSLGRLIRIKALDKYERELLVLSLEKEKNKFIKQSTATSVFMNKILMSNIFVYKEKILVLIL